MEVVLQVVGQAVLDQLARNTATTFPRGSSSTAAAPRGSSWCPYETIVPNKHTVSGALGPNFILALCLDLLGLRETNPACQPTF